MKLLLQIGLTLAVTIYIGNVFVGLLGGALIVLLTIKAFMEGMSS